MMNDQLQVTSMCCCRCLCYRRATDVQYHVLCNRACCHEAIFSKTLAWVLFAAFLCTEMAKKIDLVHIFMTGNWFEILASFRG